MTEAIIIALGLLCVVTGVAAYFVGRDDGALEAYDKCAREWKPRVRPIAVIAKDRDGRHSVQGRRPAMPGDRGRRYRMRLVDSKFVSSVEERTFTREAWRRWCVVHA